MKPEKILAILDRNASIYFPSMNDPKIRLASSRLTVLAKSSDSWAVIVETFGFTSVMTGDERFVNVATIYSSRTSSESSRGNPNRRTRNYFPFRLVTSSAPQLNVSLDEVAVPNPILAVINGVTVIVPFATRLKKNLIGMPGEKLARLLATQIGWGVFASKEQLLDMENGKLPILLQVGSWEHPDIMGDELPSDVQSFQSLATAISNMDVLRFNPGKVNSTWEGWPENEL